MKYKSRKSSFIHAIKKFGAHAVDEHSFLGMLKYLAINSNNWFAIDRELAQYLVQVETSKEWVMCQEVDMYNRDKHDTDYIQVYADDLDENKEFPEHWKTFVINL